MKSVILEQKHRQCKSGHNAERRRSIADLLPRSAAQKRSLHLPVCVFLASLAPAESKCARPKTVKVVASTASIQPNAGSESQPDWRIVLDNDARRGAKSAARYTQTLSVCRRLRHPSSHRHQHSADTLSCGWADACGLHDLSHRAARSPAVHPLLRSAGSRSYHAGRSFQRAATPRTPLLLQPLEQTTA